MEHTIQTLFIYLIIGLFVVGGGMFFMVYQSGGLEEPSINASLEEGVPDSTDVVIPIDGSANLTSETSKVIHTISWKKQTINKVLSMMGANPTDSAEEEGRAVFYATKNLILLAIFLFGAVVLAISAVSFISKQSRRNDEF